MAAPVEDIGIMSPGRSQFRDQGISDRQERKVTSLPLMTAIRIARERQRSKSSRRKIFREDPERYLDIVNLMRETGTE